MPSFNALRFSSLKMFLRLNIFSEQMFFCRIAAVDWIALFKRHSFATYKQTWLIDYGIAWNHFSVSFLNKTGTVCDTGELRSTFFLSQNISMAIQRSNASCVIGTAPQTEGLDTIFDYIDHTDHNSEPQIDLL